MAISLKTAKQIWGGAASRCSFPTCKDELIVEATTADEEAIVGDICHIVALSPEGPRGESELTLEERDKPENLILLCKVHHKTIDDQPNHYTVEVVQSIKSDHLAWIDQALKAKRAYSAFVLFEVFYNLFWIQEHSMYASKTPEMRTEEYTQHIFQRLNRCNKAFAALNVKLPSIESSLKDMYSEFRKGSNRYTAIHGLAYQLELQARNVFIGDSDKKIITLSRALTAFLKDKVFTDDVDSAALILSIEDYLGGSDPIISSIFQSCDDRALERRLVGRLEEII